VACQAHESEGQRLMCERCDSPDTDEVIVTTYWDGPASNPFYSKREGVCKRCWQANQDSLMALLKERAREAFSNFSKGV